MFLSFLNKKQNLRFQKYAIFLEKYSFNWGDKTKLEKSEGAIFLHTHF